eukprot:jgi/Chlat1/5225/Chrsp33S05006
MPPSAGMVMQAAVSEVEKAPASGDSSPVEPPPDHAAATGRQDDVRSDAVSDAGGHEETDDEAQCNAKDGKGNHGGKQLQHQQRQPPVPSPPHQAQAEAQAQARGQGQPSPDSVSGASQAGLRRGKNTATVSVAPEDLASPRLQSSASPHPAGPPDSDAVTGDYNVGASYEDACRAGAAELLTFPGAKRKTPAADDPTKGPAAASNGKQASKFRGVTFSKSSNKWRAKMYSDGKDRSLGYFAREKDAALAYDRAVRARDGPNALTNQSMFPMDFVDGFPAPDEQAAAGTPTGQQQPVGTTGTAGHAPAAQSPIADAARQENGFRHENARPLKKRKGALGADDSGTPQPSPQPVNRRSKAARTPAFVNSPVKVEVSDPYVRSGPHAAEESFQGHPGLKSAPDSAWLQLLAGQQRIESKLIEIQSRVEQLDTRVHQIELQVSAVETWCHSASDQFMAPLLNGQMQMERLLFRMTTQVQPSVVRPMPHVGLERT